MILLLHNRYRVTGGEERAVEDLAWLIPRHLGEDAAVLERDSKSLSPARAAAGMLGGGLDPERIGAAVRRTGARVVHAHNVNPSLGWRSLAAARAAGARVVLHLHNYRLVCAVGTCYTGGEDCTRCHGRHTAPGVRLNCRGGSRAESAVYAAGLSAWQGKLAEQVDAFVVPSAFALARLRHLGAPVGERAHVVASVQRDFATGSTAAAGTYALAVGRLTPEKGFADVIVACARVRRPLVVAGDGPQRVELEALAAGLGASVRFTGHVPAPELAELRRGAAVAVVASRYAEILPLAALEAMAAGLPVVAAAAGGLAEIVPREGHYEPGDVAGLGDRLSALWGDAAAGERALAVARERTAPAEIAAHLAAIYG